MLQDSLIDQGVASYSDFDAHLEHVHEERMESENGDQGAGDDSSGIIICCLRGDPLVRSRGGKVGD